MHRTILLLLLLGWSALPHAQTPDPGRELWTDLPAATVELAGKTRPELPLKFRLLELDADRLRQRLAVLPPGYDPVATRPTITIELPLPDGAFEPFTVYSDPVMDRALSARYPEIVTLAGYSTRDRSTAVRLDLSPHGFNAQVLPATGPAVYIRPVAVGNDRYHLSYFKKDSPKSGDWQCHTDDHDPDFTGWKALASGAESVGDCGVRHEYRLALSCSGEYAAFHGGTVALALAAMNTTMNRVNGVFERDFAIRMNLIADNDQLVYIDALTDPFTNPGDADVTVGENVSNTNTVIGSGDYDIGHVFTIGSGGLAWIQGVCNGTKARATTGLGSPIGDVFDIDYVAHEMGHQFGGDHTQYNDCQRNAATAMEPGSASTIMGYAGICSPNVQSNSDAYFHMISVSQIRNYVASGGGSGCDNAVAVPNTAPAVTPVASYSIPVSTPFVLTASAFDSDGQALTYCWEQTDAFSAPAQTMPPAATNTTGPMFRSLNPTTSPSRYFPNLASILDNTDPEWEELPSVGRAMHFTVTVRDNVATAGCTGEATTTVTTVGTAGPFRLTSIGASELCLFAGDATTITWDVANTTAAPVSCANVDIWLSTDGGQNFGTLLAGNVPNDGSESVTIPATAITDQARIMVRGAGNIFFDVNDRAVRIDCPLNRTVTDNPANGRYRAREVINTAGTVTVPAGATTEFFAGEEVLLADGFTAEAGSNFVAQLRPCDPCLAARPLALAVPEKPAPQVNFIEKMVEERADGTAGPRSATQVYPNPFVDGFTLVFEQQEAGRTQIEVTDAAGRTVLRVSDGRVCEAGRHQVHIDATTLRAGLYVCKITSGQGQERVLAVKAE